MLITFEGIDGSGKSTQARLLEERLKLLGYPVVLFREPGGTVLSERIRDLLLDPTLQILPLAELLLFSAARAQLVEERIKPELATGNLVICDRFFDSTTAYQGGGRRLFDVNWLASFHRRVTGGLVPDRTYLIDVNPEAAASRRAVRAGAHPGLKEDRMEASGEGFQGAVAEAYARIAAEEPDRVRRIDGRLTPEAVHAQVWADLQPLLHENRETSVRRSGTGH